MIDIDNTICKTKNSDYYNSIPYYERIDCINKLYKEGNMVVYWTSRGAKSGRDWSNFTNRQLDAWGCMRHCTRFDKPSFDYFIDDKCHNTKFFFDTEL
jgi:hypothetical protein